MKYFITGGMGFLGSHFTEKLLKDGHEVCSIDLYENKSLSYLNDWDSYKPIIDTIHNSSVVNKLIDSSDVVMHLAAIAEPEQYVKYPRKTIDINLRASLNILDRVIATDKLFFYSSTSEVYGKNTSQPFSENSDRVLGATSVNRWCYSTSKSMVEHYCRALYQDDILNFVGIRVFNCYGPRLGGRVISKFLDKIVKGDPLIIHGDGSQQRCYTYVDDLIEATMMLINDKNTHGDFYNVGNPKEEYSVKELSKIILDISGKKDYRVNHVNRSAYGKSYEDPDRRVPDISKIQEATGWSPKTDIYDGLSRVYDYQIRSKNIK